MTTFTLVTYPNFTNPYTGEMKGPTVTKELIESRITKVEYHRPFPYSPHITICGITMNNGFVFIGKSAPVSPGNFDQNIGEQYAYEDAFKQIWSHEGYVLANDIRSAVRAQSSEAKPHLFRTKAVDVEAVETQVIIKEYDRNGAIDLPSWVVKAIQGGGIYFRETHDTGEKKLFVHSNEWVMMASDNSMIIRGELYPCDMDVFEAKYMKAE